jgi:DNA gyrase subunit B
MARTKSVEKTAIAAAATKVANDYTGKDIKELPFPECVQVRPQMYIGPNDSAGYLTAIREIINNSVDEFLAGFATAIIVTRHDDYSFSVYDNGRGVPFDKQDDGSNTLSKIFGKLHAGRNFEKKTVYSTGLNGVGASCVNALSAIFYVEAQRGTDKGEITFNNGYEQKVKVSKNVALPADKRYKKSSTRVNFQFNPQFFEEGTLPIEEEIVKFLREVAQLNSGLTVEYHSCHQEKPIIHNFKEGVADFLAEAVGKKGIIAPVSLASEVINDTKIEIALTWNDSFASDNITSFTNTIKTTEGGTHVTGFKRSLSQKVTAFVREKNLTKEKIDNEDVFVGLEAVVSVFVFNPKYSSQTKQKLVNTDVAGHVLSYANAKLDEWMNNSPKEMKILATKFALSAKSRLAQKRALENVKKESGSFVTSLSNISKFVDCQEKDGVRTELYLVEGKLPSCSH